MHSLPALMTNRGFTLIELIIASVVTTIIAAAAVAFVAGDRDSSARAERRLEWTGAAHASFTTLARDCRTAPEVTADPAALRCDAVWRLDQRVLRRGDTVMARDVTAFEATLDGPRLTVSLRFAGDRIESSHRTVVALPRRRR